MKQKLYLILAGLLLVSINLKAQAPFAFNYQGVARNAAGEVLPDQMIALRFTIHQTATGGTIVYQEIQLDSTNLFGLFTASLGFGTQTQGDFSTIAWGNGVYFLQVEMDVTGTGTNYLDMGAQQLLSMPYALYAASSGSSLTGDNWGTQVAITDSNITGAIENTIAGDGLPSSPLKIAQQGATSGQALEWNGTTWKPADVSGGSSSLTASAPLSIASSNISLIGTSGGILYGTGTASAFTAAGPTGDLLEGQGAGNPPTWVPAGSLTGDNWGTQVAITDSTETGAIENTITGDGLPTSPLKLAQQGATSGEVLSWNGTTWIPTTASLLSTPVETLFTPTDGATIDAIIGTNIVNPSGGLAALTIQLPSSPTNGQCVELKFTSPVVTLTYSGGTVAASAITNTGVGSDIRLFYDSGTTSTWY